jgi:hypothetical protein
MTTGYEVAFSHTARVAYEKLRIEAEIVRASPIMRQHSVSRLHRTRMLLAKVGEAGSAIGDHVMSGQRQPLPPDLRYRSEESTFIYYRRIEAVRLVVIAMVCEMKVQQAGDILIGMMHAGELQALASLGIPAVPLVAAARFQ